jgi:threonine dehydratase
MFELVDVQAAARRIAGRVHRTPLLSASRLGTRGGVQLWLKAESLQKTGSFKSRGALNAVTQLSADDRARGVIAVSAGNHAQALAWASTAVGARCTVVMPAAAVQAKVDASRGYGATVIQHESGSAMFARAFALAEEHGYVFIHPFDNVHVAAGAGTVALEILEDLPDLDAIIVPVGGGGLLSGVAVALKALRPSVRVFGVEPEGASTLRMSLDAGTLQTVDVPRTVADGLAAPTTSQMVVDITRRLVDDVIVLPDEEIVDAMRHLLASAKLMAEPAGAAATAALLSGRLALPAGARVVSIVSGGNLDLARLQSLL